MNNIEVFNQTEKEFNNEEIINILNYACKKEKINNIECNVILVGDEFIHQMNKEYRGIDRATDVISFALEDEKKSIVKYDKRILGDIYISLDTALRQAEENNQTFAAEVIFLSVHGFFHLLGYDHMQKDEEEIMFRKQREVIESYAKEREKEVL